MAPADEEPARPAHRHEAAPASVPPAPPVASWLPPAAAAAAAAADPSSPSSSSSAASGSPRPPAPTAAAASSASPTPVQALAAARPPTASPQPDGSPSASAVAASASQPQHDGDDAGSDNMSTHSAALSAAHHGLALTYPASAAASPSAYLPSSNLPSGQYVPYPTPSQSVDAYRASPVGTSAPLSLPSMRTMEAMSQQPVSQPPPAPHHTMALGVASPLASVSNAPAFYPHHAMALPSNYSLAHDAISRLPLPHDHRILGSRGPKKVPCQQHASFQPLTPPALCTGNQAPNQDRVPDVSQTKNQGQ